MSDRMDALIWLGMVHPSELEFALRRFVATRGIVDPRWPGRTATLEDVEREAKLLEKFVARALALYPEDFAWAWGQIDWKDE